MKRWGAPKDVIEAIQPEQTETYGVWEEHWKAVRAFLAVSSQWRVAIGMGGMVRLGLDYTGVKAGLKLAGIKLKPREWQDLRTMETAARDALNEGQAG